MAQPSPWHSGFSPAPSVRLKNFITHKHLPLRKVHFNQMGFPINDKHKIINFNFSSYFPLFHSIILVCFSILLNLAFVWKFLIWKIWFLALLITCFITEKRHSTYSYSADSTLPYFEGCPSRSELDETRRNSNLPLFDLRTIVAATYNFSISNKLGQGGFGPVYKVVSLN